MKIKTPKHNFFAFIPIKTKTGWVWLKWIKRVEKLNFEWVMSLDGWYIPHYYVATDWRHSHFEKI